MALFFGLILIGFGYFLHFWLEKRRFNRMSSGGVQQYEDYRALWKSRITEGVVKVLGFFVMVFGLGLTAYGVYTTFFYQPY